MFTNEVQECISGTDVNFSRLLEAADSWSSQKYDDAWQHFQANQWAALIKKYPYTPQELKLDPEGVAKRKFLSSEHKCKWVNRKFRLLRSKRSPNEAFIDRARSFIRYVLGDAPDWEAVFNESGFGPGAAIGVSGNATNASRKLLAERYTVTPGAFNLGFGAVCANAHLWELFFPVQGGHICFDVDQARTEYHRRVTTVIHNKITFVPKTARTHRAIAVEPLWNGYLQKGVDAILRRRLKRIGIDLTDQRRNQLYAQFGSEDWLTENGFCTLDLSSASDSVSIELVRTLLPGDWFAMLDSLRSKWGQIDNTLFPYQKFCSMGNGFCFPLETLIFCAVCHAAGAGKPRLDYQVYGDDIIVRRPYVEDVIAGLRDFGFSLNASKSFWMGPFRESCGEDYLDGVSVRPYTLKNRFDSLQSIIKFVNLTRRNDFCKRFFGDLGYHTFGVPPELRFVRPHEGPADTAVTVEFDSFLSSPFALYNRAEQRWSWVELLHTPVEDRWWRKHEWRDAILVYGVLSGSDATTPYSVRRKTRTMVRRI